MLTRYLAFAAVLFAGVAEGRAAEATKAPNAVLRVRSLADLIADVKFVAELEGGAEAVQQIDRGLDSSFGKERAGLDIKKPAGVYANLGGNNVESIVLLLPIADQKAFLAHMRKWFGDYQEKDGVYTLPRNWFTPHGFRFANQYVYLCWMNLDELGKARLLDPAKVLASERDATLSLTFHIDGIPRDMRKLALEELNRCVSATAANLPGETDLQRKLRTQVVTDMSRWMAHLNEDGDKLEFFAGVDRQRQEIYGEVNLSGKPNTRLAESIAQLGQAKSRFAALPEAGLMKLLLHWSLSDDLTEAIRPVVDESIRRAMQNAAVETIREHAVAVAKALEPTLKPGELDLGIHMFAPAKDGTEPTLLAGLKVREGEKIDAAVRALVKSLPERDRERFKFDVGQADGVAIHRADVGDYLEDSPLQIFGRKPMHFSIGKDVVLVALGPDGQRMLTQALKAQPVPGPQVHYELSALAFAPVLATGEAKAKFDKAAQEIFKDKDADKIRFTIGGGKALQARLTVKAPVIQFLSRTQGNAGQFWRWFR